MRGKYFFTQEVTMFSVNEVSLAGFVSKDPEVGITKSGKTLCTFVLAVSNNSKTDPVPRLQYFDVETWNKLAEFCAKTVKRGKQVQVKGKLRQDRWEGADGRVRSRIKLVGKTIQFLQLPKSEDKEEAVMAHIS